MTHSGPGSSMRRRPYQESNGRVAEQNQLQLKAIHRPRFKTKHRPRLKSGRRQQRVSRRQRHMAQGGGGGSSNGRPYS
ncbi:unnamed protein product, partial [Staurois parvus]